MFLTFKFKRLKFFMLQQLQKLLGIINKILSRHLSSFLLLVFKIKHFVIITLTVDDLKVSDIPKFSFFLKINQNY